MKKLPIIVCLLLSCYLSQAQQIITPSFMHYTVCPVGFSMVDYCVGWRQPTGGTSDYFNVCGVGTDVGIPDNYFGHQTSPDSAYTGLYTYVPFAMQDYKEYIGTTISPLVVGHTYTMSITVSLSDSSTYATDGLGVFFSTYPVDSPSLASTLLVTPQVDYSSLGVVTDKNNWVTLSKTFVADSAYTNLVVGAFKQDINLHIDTVTGGDPIFNYSYYYIGRIGIPDSTTQPVDTIVIPPVDTTVITPPVDTIKIIEPEDTTKHVFPSGFTPNGDGKNDVFRIITTPGYVYQGYSLSVFNRFGERVFFSHDADAGWDGTYLTVPQEIGAYFYMCQFTISGKQKMLRGDVTLVR